jgi:hypothetical protein
MESIQGRELLLIVDMQSSFTMKILISLKELDSSLKEIMKERMQLVPFHF